MFSEILKTLRKEYRVTAKELSTRLNCSNNLIYDWEKGRCEPSFSTLCKIADFFNVTTDYLLGREDDFGNVVVSGERVATISRDERELLDMYQALTLEQRVFFIKALRGVISK